MICALFLWVVLFLSFLHNINPIWTDVELISIESYNGTSGFPIVYDIRLKRIKKGVFGVSGTMLITDVFDEYTCEILLFHSAARNNVYKLLPFSNPDGPICPKVEKEYRQYMMNDLQKISDLPYSKDESTNLCAMFTKGKTFTLSNYMFDKKLLPVFMKTGMYKMQYTARKNGVVTCGLEVLADLS